MTYRFSKIKGAWDQDCVGASEAQLQDVLAYLSFFIHNIKVDSGKGGIKPNQCRKAA